MSLAGGSGWAILDFNFHTGDLRTYWAGNHTQTLASGCTSMPTRMGTKSTAGWSGRAGPPWR